MGFLRPIRGTVDRQNKCHRKWPPATTTSLAPLKLAKGPSCFCACSLVTPGVFCPGAGLLGPKRQLVQASDPLYQHECWISGEDGSCNMANEALVIGDNSICSQYTSTQDWEICVCGSTLDIAWENCQSFCSAYPGDLGGALTAKGYALDTCTPPVDCTACLQQGFGSLCGCGGPG